MRTPDLILVTDSGSGDPIVIPTRFINCVMPLGMDEQGHPQAQISFVDGANLEDIVTQEDFSHVAGLLMPGPGLELPHHRGSPEVS